MVVSSDNVFVVVVCLRLLVDGGTSAEVHSVVSSFVSTSTVVCGLDIRF